jgi:glycosyltransferase involved in cell wall biosynthesis
MLAGGHEVLGIANGSDSNIEGKLRTMGVEYASVRIARAGMNPFSDIITLIDLILLMRRVKPDVVLSYTIKPIIYGGLAARFCGVRNVFSMIEGLGRTFMIWESIPHAISSIIAKSLYRIGLLGSKRVFFLNPDDLQQFVKKGYVPQQKAVLLDGIGIDLTYYVKENLDAHPSLRFLMIARLLKDKGVREYIEAARIVRARGRHVEFILAGDMDENPSSIKQEELNLWQRDGIVNYLGWVDDVRLLYKDCHVYVLPSYREGTPAPCWRPCPRAGLSSQLMPLGAGKR